MAEKLKIDIDTTGQTERRSGARKPACRALLAGGLAAGALLLSPGTGHAADAGVFKGLEFPPASTTYGGVTALCATFDPAKPFDGETAPSGPLRHELTVVAGTSVGIATFTRNAKYDANPEGVWPAGSQCVGVPSGITGVLTVNVGAFSCTDNNATYNRRATSVYTVTSTPCGVSFVGTQLVCNPLTGCATDPNSDASAEMAGAYAQA